MEQMPAHAAKQSRPHLYEVDLLRVVTALGVVVVHTVFFTLPLNHTALGVQVQNTVVNSFHFTRESFMFITALVLVYGYHDRPLSLKRFWKSRSIGVLLPYVVWSVFYSWVALRHQPPGAMAAGITVAILTGNASYQLYYILLTLQFYLVFPWFLWFIKRVEKHPWTLLSVSFAIQVILLYFDYRYLQTPLANANGALWIIANYQNRFFIVYQFYFILGAMVAIYLRQTQALVERYGRWIIAAMVAMLAIFWADNFIAVDALHQSMGYVSSVLQPIMTFYSLAVIAFLFWIGRRWATHTKRSGQPSGYKVWRALADASFGIYLVHPFILSEVQERVIPHLPADWPVAIQVFLIWVLVAGSASAVSIILMNIPILSRLVGRSQPMPRIPLLAQATQHQDPDKTLVLPRVTTRAPLTRPNDTWDPDKTLILPRIRPDAAATQPLPRPPASNGHTARSTGPQNPNIVPRGQRAP
jgi:peptidoglycan/LPS O-acetylase OafA/YrhL